MDVRGAIKDTMYLVRHAQNYKSPAIKELSLAHLEEMERQVNQDPSMSYGKLCRWLGWMQAAVVASGVAVLEDMKDINRGRAD